METFRDAFETIHAAYGLQETLKVHIVYDHLSEYFDMTGIFSLNN